MFGLRPSSVHRHRTTSTTSSTTSSTQHHATANTALFLPHRRFLSTVRHESGALTFTYTQHRSFSSPCRSPVHTAYPARRPPAAVPSLPSHRLASLATCRNLIPHQTQNLHRTFSTRSHMSGILFSQIFLHSAFRSAIQQLHDLLGRLRTPLQEGETRESQLEEVRNLTAMLESAVRGYSDMEDAGWLPGLHEEHPVTRRVKQLRVREAQTLRHMHRPLDRLRRHHASLDKHPEDIDKLDGMIQELRALLSEHFEAEEKELLPKYAEAFEQSQMAEMFHRAVSQLHHLPRDSTTPVDRKTVHQMSWEYNSMEMCEAMVREVLTLPEETAARVLHVMERHAPPRVWQELRHRLPEMAVTLETHDHV